MENTHKRTLRAVYNEYEKNYTDLLADHDEISIHQMHLQFLAIEVFKSANKLNPQFMWCFFENHEIPSNLRCASVVKLPGTNTTKHGINSLNLRGAMLLNSIPKIIKLTKTLPEFKKRLKKHLIPSNCAECRFSIIEKAKKHLMPCNCAACRF